MPCIMPSPDTGSSAGIGFAIPVDTVKAVVPQLIAGGKAERAGLNAQVGRDYTCMHMHTDTHT